MTGLVSAFLGHDFIAFISIHPPTKLTSGIPRPVIGDSMQQASRGANAFTRVDFAAASVKKTSDPSWLLAYPAMKSPTMFKPQRRIP